MTEAVSKILFIVEGEKMEPKIMNHILAVYGLDKRYEVIPYRTNIYGLYKEMFSDGHPEEWDLLQIMKSHAKEDEKAIFDCYYSDIVLVFDMELQHPGFSVDKIREMASYFTESSDMGKLYINYPMVEAFYHMKSVPDRAYNSYEIAVSDVLVKGKYKDIVKKLCRCGSFDDFFKRIATRAQCTVLIRQNIDKARLFVYGNAESKDVPDQNSILQAELSYWEESEKIKVLCTCIFFIADYNSAWVNEQAVDINTNDKQSINNTCWMEQP